MKIILPRNNLGCLGFKITKNLYFDFFGFPCFGNEYGTYPGMYLRYRNSRWWVNFRELRISKGR